MFVLLSIVGLGVNELCMWLGTDLMGIHYMITKIGATAIVMDYNFVTRKMLIEKKNKKEYKNGCATSMLAQPFFAVPEIYPTLLSIS